MVDAHRARVREHVVHHLAVHAITSFGQIIRIERRLAPILTLLVVEVRWAAHGYAAYCETFRIPPHVRAERVHAHGHILHEAECHTAVTGGVLRGCHLLVGDPLQPAFEIDHIGVLAHELHHFRRIAVRVLEPRAFPRRAPHLERHRPCGERAQIRTRGLLERVERGLTLDGTRHVVHKLQRLALVPPSGIDVERLDTVVGWRGFRVQTRHFGLVRLVEFRIFSDILRTDVRHIEKTTRFGKIRRRLQRRHRRGGVNRVDKHEIGMRFRCRVGQQQLQIAIVAHAPGFSGTDGIHLCHPAPTLLFRYCWRQFDACRCADQRGFGVQRAGIDGQRVVAGGNIVRQRQLQRAVICVRARQIRGQIARIFRAVFQRQLQRHVVSFRADWRDGFLADELHDGRLNKCVCDALLGRRIGGGDRFVAGCVHAECGQYGDEHFVADFHIGAELVDIRRGNAIELGELDKRPCDALCAFGLLGLCHGSLLSAPFVTADMLHCLRLPQLRCWWHSHQR